MRVADVAAELIEDYHNILMDSIEDEFIRKLVAKQCALIAAVKVEDTVQGTWYYLVDSQDTKRRMFPDLYVGEHQIKKL